MNPFTRKQNRGALPHTPGFIALGQGSVSASIYSQDRCLDQCAKSQVVPGTESPAIRPAIIFALLVLGLIAPTTIATELAPSNTVRATRVIHFEGNPQICAGIINGINGHMVAYNPVNNAVTAAAGIPLDWIGQILSMTASPVNNEITIAVDLSKPVGPSPDHYLGPAREGMPKPITPLPRAAEVADAAAAALIEARLSPLANTI